MSDTIRSPIHENGTDMKRTTTFSRFLTFTGQPNESMGRRSTTNFFNRTFTDTVGLTYASEEQWTKSLIAQYVAVSEKGVDGDMPPPLGFGRERRFWRMMLLAGILGCVMGCTGCAFLNLADEGPKYWTNNLEKRAKHGVSALDFYAGEINWIFFVMATGFVVGVIRFATNFPEVIAGIFKEINTYHVDYNIAPRAILLSTISLSGGANLGPEQALGTVGGGVASYLLEMAGIELDEDDRKLLVLTGMTAAIGALFPSPILTVMMMYELGHPPRTNMESVTILSFAALSAFACYTAIVGTDKTWLRWPSQDGILIAADWKYDNWQLCSGFVIGVVSGFLSLTSIIFIGACKQIFQRIRKRLERFKFLQAVVPPMIAGALIGLFNWVMPLTVGNGNQLLPSIIQYGYTKELSSNQLVCAAFARMLTLGMSMNCVGFVGGFIFPTITIAIMAGVVCYQQFDYLPYGMCIGCFIAGLPSGICPMPFTLACLAIFMFFFGFFQTAPILVATITSYVIVCGSGLFAAMQLRAKEAEEMAKQAEADANGGTRSPSEVGSVASSTTAPNPHRVAEDTLSLNTYLKSKGTHTEVAPI